MKNMLQYITITPGDEACIISGLNFATSDTILGLRAKDRGTFVYHGQGKLKINEHKLVSAFPCNKT